MQFLTPEKRAKVLKGADRAASAYLESLGKQGIKPTDIHEVHHTSTGIDKVFKISTALTLEIGFTNA